MRLCKIDGASQGAFVDDELVLIHTETGKFFALKDTALQIWNLLDTQAELESIQAELGNRYAVDPATCRQEVQDFAEQLVEAGFARYC